VVDSSRDASRTEVEAAPSRPDRRVARHAATKREIVGAAWDLSLQRGLAGWALKDVGDAVGMRAPSLYGYFDGKHALYDAMFAEGCRELLAIAQTSPRVRDDPRATVLRAARVFINFCVANPARFQLLFLRTVPGFEPSTESYALAVEVLGVFVDVLRDAGVTDPADVDLWTAVLTGLASQQVSNDPGGTRWSGLVETALIRLLPPA
jgi:AcrR family transcriptional regulator